MMLLMSFLCVLNAVVPTLLRNARSGRACRKELHAPSAAVFIGNKTAMQRLGYLLGQRSLHVLVSLLRTLTGRAPAKYAMVLMLQKFAPSRFEAVLTVRLLAIRRY